MGTSLAGRVSATAGAFFKEHSKQAAVGLNRKSKEFHSSALSLLKPTLATPLLTWTLQTQINFRHLIEAGLWSPPTLSLWRIGLPGVGLGGEYGAKAHSSLHSFRFRRRQSFRDSGIFLTAARGNDTFVEEIAAVEDFKVREATLATRSLSFKWRLLSLFANLVLCGLHWLDGVCTRGQEFMQPLLERLKMRSEPLRYWTYISCLLFCWLSAAFFLHWQVQRWELSTMVIADRQGVTDGSFDPGGSFCHSVWPNTGLGCQISFTAM